MDPKQLLLEHFEKGIVGLAAVWLVIAGVGVFDKPEALGKSSELTQGQEAIARYMSAAEVPAPPPPGYLGELRDRLDPERVERAGALPAWSMHRRPGFLFSTTPPPPTVSPEHHPPVEVAGDASQRGKVTLTWRRSNSNRFVIATSYEVERRVGADGEWERIVTVGGQETRYEDTDVRPRAQYYYRVVSVAEIERDHAVVRQQNLTLAADQARKVSLERGPFQIQRDVFLIPILVDAPTDEKIIRDPTFRPSAQVRVYKWDAETGKFESHSFYSNIYYDDPIGGMVQRGRRHLDFTTGATLIEVEMSERDHPRVPGHKEPVQVIKYRFDGEDEIHTATDKDDPPS